jgi:hypothetical protein
MIKYPYKQQIVSILSEVEILKGKNNYKYGHLRTLQQQAVAIL